MAGISPNLSKLIDLYKTKNIAHPHLKPASVAQWILESGWGRSQLARSYNNFAGIKYRPALKDFARRVRVQGREGGQYFAHFFDLESFIEGYWANLERSPYKGWKKVSSDPVRFLRFIGPVWAEDPAYVSKLLRLLPEAQKLMGQKSQPEFDAADLEKFLSNARLRQILAGFFNDPRFLEALRGSRFLKMLGGDLALFQALPDTDPADSLAGCCGPEAETAQAPIKPEADYIPSPNWSSRNGTRIDHIVIHYTVSATLGSVITQFRKTRAPRRSAHYIIDRGGRLVQMVHDSRKAWHANGKNARSIGIEHVAMPGQRIAPAQARTSLALIRWLMAEYHIPKANIIPHKCVPRNTRCCGDLFAAYKKGKAPYSCKSQFEALQEWLSEGGIS